MNFFDFRNLGIIRSRAREPAPAFFVKRIIILAGFALLIACQLSGAGLTVYSYRDDQGQTIVVDSLEKIPAQFRKQAGRQFIPSFRQKKKPAITVIEAIPDQPGSEAEQPAPKNSGNSSLTIVEPPAETHDAEIASATAILESLKLLQLNNERIFVVSEGLGTKHPSLELLNRQNLLTLQTTERDLADGTWKIAAPWQPEAQRMIDYGKSLQLSISKWLAEGGSRLKTGLPPLLSACKIRLQQLEQTLSRLIPAPKNEPDTSRIK